MNYKKILLETKKSYPFERWREAFDDGLEVYTEENCAAMENIFDELIANLIVKGENASESEKIEAFRAAIEATNELDGDTAMIETGEREDLCELTNAITLAAGLNPDNYGEGEGLASEWRDW